MLVGRLKRKFLVRVIDLEENKSKNFSIYIDDGEDVSLDRIFSLIKNSAKCLMNDGHETNLKEKEKYGV